MVPGVSRRDVWVTGIGLVSSLGDGIDEHWARLNVPCSPIVAAQKTTGFLVHPLQAADFSSQITNKLDLKRMGGLQSSGVYAAGRALENTGLKGAADILSRSIVVVGGAGGERDTMLDEKIFSELDRFSDPGELNLKLAAGMRPSTFLSQLPNLLAGNISIHFGVTGGSRTTLGEELAGATALKTGYQLLTDGAYDVALVGGACNADREDLQLTYSFGKYLLQDDYKPVWARTDRNGGFILGSMGVFLVLEDADHARSRGATPYCRICGFAGRHTGRAKGAVTNALTEAWRELESIEPSGPLGIISGATGVSPATEEELAALTTIACGAPIRSSGSVFGHGVEASFPLGVSLGAIALRHGRVYPAFPGDPGSERTDEVSRILVTSVGHWRGETIALLTAPEA